MDSSNENSLIAPCGMNCGICSAYLRQKKKCPGCRGSDTTKSVSCVRCKIKQCEFFTTGAAEYCLECEKCPCDNLKHLDKRYRTRYNMSMIENLGNIENLGIKEFVENEKERWRCSDCGGTICVHKGSCSICGKKR